MVRAAYLSEVRRNTRCPELAKENSPRPHFTFESAEKFIELDNQSYVSVFYPTVLRSRNFVHIDILNSVSIWTQSSG